MIRQLQINTDILRINTDLLKQKRMHTDKIGPELEVLEAFWLFFLISLLCLRREIIIGATWQICGGSHGGGFSARFIIIAVGFDGAIFFQEDIIVFATRGFKNGTQMIRQAADQHRYITDQHGSAKAEKDDHRQNRSEI